MMSVKNARNSNPDVISDLPSNLIENILMCLPLQDAVRTSILSSKWRYKWVTLPRLVFDDKLCSKCKLPTAVYQVLLHHKGPILGLTLSVEGMKSSDVNSWILFVSKDDIRDFTLSMPSWGWLHKLHSYFYSFLKLRHLALHSCVFKPPATFRGFSTLVSLKFSMVVFVADTFSSFISSCPLLRILNLRVCTSFECLEIDAPSHEDFSFYGTCKILCFKNTPLLAKANIFYHDMVGNVENFMEGETCNLMKVFGGLPRIEVLHLNSYFLESMAADDMRERLPIELKCLKTLDLACNCFEKVDVVAFVLWLIRSSPNLRRLAVAALTNEDAAVEPVVNFFRAQDCSSCSFNKLGEVVMEIYSGTESELEFAKYLLATSSVLETMHIWPNEEDGLNGFKILKELVRLRRASPKAEIVYHDQCNSSPENLY